MEKIAKLKVAPLADTANLKELVEAINKLVQRIIRLENKVERLESAHEAKRTFGHTE